jgi:hypothetical protein
MNAGRRRLQAGSDTTTGHGEKLSRKSEALIAALLVEPTVGAAATAADVSERTARTWLRQPAFLAAYRVARRRVVEAAVARIQGATSAAVDALTRNLTCGRPADEIRAAAAILDHSIRGLGAADLMHVQPEGTDATSLGTTDIVALLSARLRQLDQSELPTGEKARLSVALADSLLRAIGVDVLDKRLDALQAVLTGRKDKHI